MFSLMHISDLHFGPPYRPDIGAAVLRIAPQLGADAIVVSGDLTQRAKPNQFAAAREFLDQLPAVPTVVVPGNHDVPLYRIRERLFHPHRNFREYFPGELNQVHRLDGAVIAALDSTAPHRSISNGRVQQHQLDFCAHAFHDATSEAARIIVAHHHFAPAPDYERDQTMPKAKRALDCFVDLDVELILGGHLHRAYVGNSLDVYPGRHEDQGIIIAQCGTTTSSRGRARERAKNSFNMIHINDRSLSVTHYVHCTKEGEFLAASRHVFPRVGQPFAQDSGVDVTKTGVEDIGVAPNVIEAADESRDKQETAK